MIRIRLSVLFAAGAIAVIAAGFSHPAGAAPKAAATATPSPTPAPTATPETLDKAIPRLEAAVKANPNDAASATELATDYLSVNRADLAAAMTAKLLASGTKNAQVYFVDGESNAILGKTDAGIASMEQAANLEPTNIQVLQALTQMYMRSNRPADAERVALRAVKFNTTSKEAAENYGYVLAAEKKYDEARAQFEAAAKIDPKDVHPIVLEAQTYEDANALPLAMQLLDRALTIDPKSIEALSAKGELASAQHDVKTSIAAYDAILAQMTQDAQKANVTDLEASVYAREKQATDADAAFRRAIDSYGGLPPAHIAYGDYLMSVNDKAGALREWTAAVGPNRDNPEALGRLGQLAATNNDLNTAVSNYKRLTEVVSNDPRPWLMLGQAYMAQKNWSAAHDAFQASFRVQPSPDAMVGLAAADHQSHNFTEEIQIYEALDKNAAALVKANPGLIYGEANAYRSANQPQKAKAALVRFLAFLKPGTQGYTQVKEQIAQIDHPSGPAPKSSAKPVAKTAKPAAKTGKPAAKPSPSPTPKK